MCIAFLPVILSEAKNLSRLGITTETLRFAQGDNVLPEGYCR